MKLRSIVILTLIFNIAIACNNNTNAAKEVLNASQFSEAIQNNSDIQLLDVRTPQEFREGHIENALNYDWYDSNFKTEILNLDKEKPIYIYCRSGKRSSDAAQYLIQNGYEIHELRGGILEWQSNRLPQVTN